VGRECPPEAADSTASIAQYLDLLLRIVLWIRECLHVELVERLFDFVEGTEISSPRPHPGVPERNEGASRRPRLPFLRQSLEVVEDGDLAVMNGQEPVRANETVDDDPLTCGSCSSPEMATAVHPQVALVLLDPWSPLGISELQTLGVAKIERVQDLGCFVVRSIHEVNPEDLFLFRW